MAVAKGSALLATLGFVKDQFGSAVLQQIVDRLPAAEQEIIRSASATREIAFSLLLDVWRASDAVLRVRDHEWMERAGAHSIDSMGTQLYGGIVRKATPLEFLNQPIKLFRLYYHSGDMQVVESAPGRAVLRLVDFDEPDPLFCRRQTGGLKRVLELAGGKDPRARHVRCANEGDAFCEWELVWGE